LLSAVAVRLRDADVLVAATAEIEQISVLHHDTDFSLIAEITGLSTEWVVRRGSIP
jgi:predicted nucleic acid-binding protein